MDEIMSSIQHLARNSLTSFRQYVDGNTLGQGHQSVLCREPITLRKIMKPGISYVTTSDSSMPSSVDMTANWIFDLAKSKSWKEAESYSASFRSNEISGFTLQCITNDELESDLNIKNKEHRRVIISAILSLPEHDSYSTNLHCLYAKGSCHASSVESNIVSESWNSKTKANCFMDKEECSTSLGSPNKPILMTTKLENGKYEVDELMPPVLPTDGSFSQEQLNDE